MFQRYEDEKRAKRMVDFDDLLRLCRRDLLDDREFAQTQRWRFQHLFVDEFQDVNPLQRQLLEAWVGGRDDLCVVGDPNQAIYAWNGADPTALTGFLDRYPAGEVLRLTDNYRSSPQILAVANAVLAAPGTGVGRRRRRGLRPAGQPARRAAAGHPILRRRRGRGQGHRPCGARPPRARLARGRGRPCSCRTNAQTVLIEQALHEAGDPVPGAGQRQPARPARDQGGPRRPAPQHRRLQRGDHRPRRGRGPPGPGPGDGHRGHRIDDEPVMAFDDDRAANLATLGRLARDFAALDSRPTPIGFVAWLRTTTAGERPDGHGDAVEIVTFHAAKGLEWPVVHLAGLEQGLVPIGHAKDAASQAEERRLFYVAVTRAERELLCTWAERRTFGERESLRERSPYLDEVEAACRALSAGDVPADWSTYLAAQRATLRDLTGIAAARTGRAPRSAAGVATARSAHDRSRTPAASDLDPLGLATFDALKAWRTTRARAADVPPHVIFHDRVLLEVAATRPLTSTDLLAVPGIGEVKVKRFGDEILGIVAAHGAS